MEKKSERRGGICYAWEYAGLEYDLRFCSNALGGVLLNDSRDVYLSEILRKRKIL